MLRSSSPVPNQGSSAQVRRLIVLSAMVAISLAWFGAPTGVRGAGHQVKVAIIVGPVGEELTPVYIELADAAADAAETRGATVARAYSPDATEDNVLAAVEDANIVVYLGHGVGSPNPYTAHPNPDTTNGWALNGRSDRGHADATGDGSLVYRGEAWITAHARPAPGWVMIYSNACYAPGASEGWDEPATPEVAAQRVAAYARAPLADLDASAYFATDFYAGAAHLVGALLDGPERPYGDIFASEPNYLAAGVSRLPLGGGSGVETWLQRSPYFDGLDTYWYAFAGDPTASLAAGSDAVALTAEPDVAPLVAIDGRISGMASSYAETAGWEGAATVALPLDLGGGIPSDDPAYVQVCADRCALLPVVDSCPCYVGTADQRIVNLSLAAWAAITDVPLAEGLIRVDVDLTPTPAAGETGRES
jgi:hypothetical protein